MPSRRESQQEKFVRDFTDYALDVAAVTGLAPEVVMGQAALESGWGRSVAGNNMFGIKGAGQSVVTHEDIPGKGMVKSTENFRAYNNPLDSFMDYGRLMDNSRYGHIGKNQTVDQQVASIGKSGYATDRNYGRKLDGVVNTIQASPLFQDKAITSASFMNPTAVDMFTDVGIPTGNVSFIGDLPDPTLGAPPIGQVERLADLPDITPASAGFSLDGATLPDDFSMDFGPSLIDGPSEFTGTGSLAPAAAFSDQPIGPSQSFESIPQAGPGFSAGFDAGPWGSVPDFAAPSLQDRNATTLAQDRINAFESGLVPGFRQNDIDALNANLMAELAPAPTTPQLSAPALQASVSTPPQATTPGFSTAPMGDFESYPSATPAPTAPSLPSATPPATANDFVGWDKDKGLTIGGFSSPVDAIKSGLGLGMPNDSFMDAMASTQHAKGYSPGFLDGPYGRTAIGAAKGAMFGGLPGAVIGGALGGTGWGNQMSNQLSDFFGGAWDHMSQGWDSYDFSTHGYGAGYNDRGERSHTGRDDSGNATVGDGSYSESSGRNSNNPQGIL